MYVAFMAKQSATTSTCSAMICSQDVLRYERNYDFIQPHRPNISAAMSVVTGNTCQTRQLSDVCFGTCPFLPRPSRSHRERVVNPMETLSEISIKGNNVPDKITEMMVSSELEVKVGSDEHDIKHG